METHFIERYKDDLFVDPSNLLMAEEGYEAAGLDARLAAACIVSLEHSKLTEILLVLQALIYFSDLNCFRKHFLN